MKKMTIVAITLFGAVPIFYVSSKSDTSKVSNTTKESSEKINKDEKNKSNDGLNEENRVIYSIAPDYKAEKIECNHMKLMNLVFQEFPMALVRLFKAASASRKLLADIAEMEPFTVNDKSGEIIYFEKKDDEIAFIKNRIKEILDPIDKFLEEALEQNASIVKGLFEKILGADAKNGFLLPAIASGSKPSEYLVVNIKSIEELVGSISEFWIFFSTINASLSVEAKNAYTAKIKELQQVQMRSDANKKNESKVK